MGVLIINTPIKMCLTIRRSRNKEGPIECRKRPRYLGTIVY